jgi:hypothetical protein
LILTWTRVRPPELLVVSEATGCPFCTFTGIVARGPQNAYDIGDIVRTYPGGDHRDDHRF